MQKITPFLWFDTQAEEAANFYVSLFQNSKILSTRYYPEAAESVSGMPKGSVMTVNFQLEGQEFIALNGGPHFKFSEAISFMISCEDQVEVDRLWDILSADGEEGQCGWLKDKFDLSWQIVPKGMAELMADSDPAKANKATAAMLKMKKIDLYEMKKAMEE
jgi:predicted 3-demethylubiquinone-9 3-methyltransferase (glyoxalase superfamily)